MAKATKDKKTKPKTQRGERPSEIIPPKGVVKPDRRGRFGRGEMKKIDELVKQGVTDPQKISEYLNRNVGQIVRYLLNHYGIGENAPKDAQRIAECVRELKKSPHWKFLKEHYNSDELEYYEYIYSQVISQFGDDILASEELQLLQAIDFQLLVNRYKKTRKNIEDQIFNLEQSIEVERSLSAPNEARIVTLESQRATLITQIKGSINEIVQLSNKFDGTIERLKGTREQRIKTIESSKKSFVGLIKSLQDKAVREQENRYLETVKVATQRAEEKLIQPHKYHNGEIDQPLLRPESVLLESPHEESAENTEDDQIS